MNLSLTQNKLPNLPSKSFLNSQNETLRAKLRASQAKYHELQSTFNKTNQRLAQNQLTIATLQNQINSLKQSLSELQLYHSKTVEYLNEQIKLVMKSQKVYIDYVKRENDFLKNRLRAKNSDSMIKDSDFEKINKNPINMLIWKIEEMSCQRINEESKFKKLLIPFFSALYQSKTTDELFEECIKLFRNCGEYETAINKGEKIRFIIEDFRRQANQIFGEDELFEEMLEQ